MNFLEAKKILDGFTGGEALQLQLSASGNVDPLILYTCAVAAKKGIAVEVSTLPFGTLAQTLFSRSSTNGKEVILLLPWDLVPEIDWRSGIPTVEGDMEVLLNAASRITGLIKARHVPVIYIQAPLPPIWPDIEKNHILEAELSRMVVQLQALVLDGSWFSMGNYLYSGCPVAGGKCGELAELIMSVSAWGQHESCKVLITDLDNVMWSGLAAEEGVDGILCGPDGKGYRHFLYQGLILMLKNSGVVLAAVSRNDPDIARAPISAGKTLLAEEDFLEILASYEPKSLQIRRLADSLNLGLDAFVFVDDNPLELAEVSASLPDVHCLQFPDKDEELPSLFTEITRFFTREHISDEDRERTAMYRRKLAMSALSEDLSKGGDITEFLRQLEMTLTIFDRSAKSHERALQLINKTNQFNLNGRRWSESELEDILSRGGRLYTARLVDRTGNHGEILSCLVNDSSEIVALVMSCRVFQRQIEYVFLCWLAERLADTVKMYFNETEKNTPLRQFAGDGSFRREGESLLLDTALFRRSHEDKMTLFKLVVDSND